MQVRECDEIFAPHRPSGLAGKEFDWSSDGAVDASMGSPLGHHPRISGYLSIPLIKVAIVDHNDGARSNLVKLNLVHMPYKPLSFRLKQ